MVTVRAPRLGHGHGVAALSPLSLPPGFCWQGWVRAGGGFGAHSGLPSSVHEPLKLTGTRALLHQFALSGRHGAHGPPAANPSRSNVLEVTQLQVPYTPDIKWRNLYTSGSANRNQTPSPMSEGSESQICATPPLCGRPVVH